MKRAIWPAAFIALFFISMATFAVQKRYNGNVSGLLYIGTGVATDKVRCPDILDPDLYVRPDSGYDGQYYYFMAMDPFMKTENRYCMDSGAYRYQRILLPLLAATFSMGNNKRIPLAIVSINLLSIVLGTFVFALCCIQYKVNPWVSVLYALTNGMVLSVLRSTTEPLCLCMITVASYFYLVKQSRWSSAVFLSLAALSKETALAVAGGFLLYDFVKHRSVKLSAAFLLPFAAYLAWQLNIRAHFDFFSFTVQSHAHFNAGQVGLLGQ